MAGVDIAEMDNGGGYRRVDIAGWTLTENTAEWNFVN